MAAADPEPKPSTLNWRWGIKDDLSEAEAQEIICRIFGVTDVRRTDPTRS